MFFFGMRDEERHAHLESAESGKINIAAIHGVEGARFDGEVIEGVDVVQFAVGNADKTRDVAAQVDQGCGV